MALTSGVMALVLQGCNAGVGGDQPVQMPAAAQAVDRVTVRIHTDAPAQVTADGVPITAVPALDALWERRFSEAEQFIIPGAGVDEVVDLEMTDDQARTSRSQLHLRVGPDTGRTTDATTPALTLTASASQVAFGGMITCYLEASEDIDWLHTDMITVAGGTMTGWITQDARHSSFLVYAQDTAGTLMVTVPVRACTDRAGNFLAQAVSISVPIIAP